MDYFQANSKSMYFVASIIAIVVLVIFILPRFLGIRLWSYFQKKGRRRKRVKVVYQGRRRWYQRRYKYVR